MLGLEELRDAMQAELQDDATFLTPPEIETFLKGAIRGVNIDRPQSLVADIAGDDSADYALPSGYVRCFSTLEAVEYPAGENPPSLRPEGDDWYVYEDPTQIATEQQRLRFLLSTPQVGETIRIFFTGLYTVEETSSNLDPRGFEAVLSLALVKAYTALAAKFSQSQDPTILADSVNYQQRVQSFLFLRQRAQENYDKVSGLGGPVAAASVLSDADLKSPPGTNGFFWHPKILR